ncbi:MAG: hypothetical protein AAB590_02690 [Patescibacteria group bacterium]
MSEQRVVFFHTLGDTHLERAEDALVFVPPSLVGVLDGSHPIIDNSEREPQSPTQRLVSIGVATCQMADPSTDLRSLVAQINRRIRETMGNGGSEDQAVFPSAAFALGRLTAEGGLEILQGGDSLVAVEFSDGSCLATPNTVFKHTEECQEAVRGLEPGSREWHDVRARVGPAIQRRINKPGGWPMLNGDDAVEHYWLHRVFGRGVVRRALFFTDGLLPLSALKALERESNVKKLFKAYDDRGFEGIYESTKRHALAESKSSSNKRTPYVGEATAIALNLN